MKLVNMAYLRALEHMQKRIDATGIYRAGFTRVFRCLYQFNIAREDGGHAIFKHESPGVLFCRVADFVRINRILEGGPGDD